VVLVEAAVLLVATSGALPLWNFRSIRRVLMRSAARLQPFGSPIDAEKIVQSIERVSRRLRVGSTCLSIALTAEALLKHYGYESLLCLGAKRENGQFTAHAWIERDSAVVIGGPREITLQYTRFPSIPV
jgi:hypothetical protein